MSERTISSARFAEELALALGTGPSQNSLNSQRAALQGFAERLEQRAPKRPRLAWSLAFATVAFVALVAGFVYQANNGNTRLRASFAGEEVREERELWAQNRPQALTFSDGSELLLNADTRAQVSSITADRAELRLNEGHILASIHKSTGMTWTIAVGPYAVRVVGTRFSVDWDRSSRMLEVEVKEGRVRVSGGDLPVGGVALDAGARLERHYRGRTAAPDPLAEQAQEPASAKAQPGSVVLDLNAAATASGAPARSEGGALAPVPSGAVAPAASFVGLANKGKYREALELAEKQGFERLSATLPENDLVTLANVARFSGNAERARGALLRLRQRFPGRPAAELAALYLARVAEDLEHRPSEAARWLRVFLQESPAGDLAAGARANLISVLLGMGDSAGARAVAEDYVRYHPSGPHLEQARAAIARGRPQE
jgi:TolA-binding protein